MPRSYRHINDYEKEILELKESGLTKNEIGKQLGFTFEQIHNFISRYNRNKRKMDAGMILKKKKVDRQKIVLSSNKTRSQN